MTTKAFQTSGFPVSRSRFTHAIAAFTASVLVAPPVGISPANAAQPPSSCLRALQQSACDATTLTRIVSTAAESAPDTATAPVAHTVAHTATHTALLNPTLDKQLADVLLGVCYVGLPVGITLAILLYDKQAHDRIVRLKAQVALLERLWKQSI